MYSQSHALYFQMSFSGLTIPKRLYRSDYLQLTTVHYQNETCRIKCYDNHPKIQTITALKQIGCDY